jgi:hypothetical protein
LIERYPICNLNNITHFLLRNEEIRQFRIYQFNKEVKKVRVNKTDEETLLFDWNIISDKKLKLGFYDSIYDSCSYSF